jgi:putative hydrolase of the HAD superfamily
VTRPPRKSAKALLVAYAGVLWRPDDVAIGRIEARSGLPPGAIQAAAYAPIRSVPAMLGQISRSAWREAIAVALVEHVGDLETAEKIVEEWYEVRGAIVPEMVAFLDELRAAGVPIGICVTGIDEVPDELPADMVIDAAEVGISIPHPEFFAIACRALAVLPKQCLYTDVSARNIAGARAAGLLAYRSVGGQSRSYLRGIFAT